MLGLAKEIFQNLIASGTLRDCIVRNLNNSSKTFPRMESPGVGASVTHRLLAKKSPRKISVLDLEEINKWQLWERLGCLFAFVITLFKKIGCNSRSLTELVPVSKGQDLN